MFFRYVFFRYKRAIGYVAGSVLAIIGLGLLISPQFADWHMPGPANTGHQKLQCTDCHRSAAGSARQQIQANLQQQIGMRQQPAYFQFKPVTNDECLDCHDRPNDRHPVQRFNEPRFAEVRQKRHPEQCIACHLEHKGGRVTEANTGYCQDCHEKFDLKHDKISIRHQTLVQRQRWDTCLGCHDYHGNHKMKVPIDVGEALSPVEIFAYFNGAKSPYPGSIIHKAKEKLDEK